MTIEGPNPRHVDEQVGEGVDKFIAHCSKAFTTFNELQEMGSVS